jgi:predicted nucleic acid-binding protein
MGSVAVDSGVLIALFDSSDVHHVWSVEQIQEIVTARHAIVISALTVAEVLVRPAQAGAAEAVRADLTSLRPRVVDVDADLAARAAELRASRSGLRLPDAIIVATALLAQCDYLVTTDQQMANAADGIPVRVSPA